MDLDLLLMALNTISQNRPPDDPNRPAFEDAVTLLRAGRQVQSMSSGATRPGDSTLVAERQEAVDLELPVGLANLRNTCYLNSILQYFYSVNAVRDLALNSEFPALEPTEENLSHLLRSSINGSSGSTSSQPDLETGRAFVGYECG
jgi:ubiquitin carboxyl-terminal hydrolase 25/28